MKVYLLVERRDGQTKILRGTDSGLSAIFMALLFRDDLHRRVETVSIPWWYALLTNARAARRVEEQTGWTWAEEDE